MLTVHFIFRREFGESWDMSMAPDSAGGKIGISFPTFSSSSNAAPEKPFKGITSYQAIKGVMDISGNITGLGLIYFNI